MSRDKPSQSVGRDLNPLRRTLGLIPIGETWVLYKTDANEEHWIIRKGSPSGKTVFKDSGRITAEEDHYYSGKRFEDRHEYGWEFVSLLYDYRTRRVVLGYSGTNEAARFIVSKFAANGEGRSVDLAGAMAAMTEIATNWPDSPKQ